MSDAPKRPVEVVITLGADDHAAALHALWNYLQMAEREYDGKCFVTTSGGSDCGYSVAVTEHPEQTHDKYFAEVDQYLADLKLREASAGQAHLQESPK